MQEIYSETILYDSLSIVSYSFLRRLAKPESLRDYRFRNVFPATDNPL